MHRPTHDSVIVFFTSQGETLFWGAPKSLRIVTTAIKLKDACFLEEKYEQPRQLIKNREITLSTKVRLVKAIAFPVVMYGCESWTIKKAERQKIDAFELWCWRRLFGVPWTEAHQASLPFTISWSFPRFMFIELVKPSNYLILCHPLLLPSVFPSIRIFSNESAVHIRLARVLKLQLPHQSFQ